MMRSSFARFKRPILAAAIAAGFAGVTAAGNASDASAATAQPAAPQAATTQRLPDFAMLVMQNGPAVVKIGVAKFERQPSVLWQEIPGFRDFFERFGIPVPEGQLLPTPAPRSGVGSGFIVSPDGTILTNAHVVDGADEVTVKLDDKRELTAKVLGVDPMTDIAVVKVDASGLPTVRIGDPSKTRVGEWVAAIGAPFGLEHSVTSGIVSAKSRSLPNGRLVPFIQTDVAVNPGNSGGPLFNMAGEVIGVNSRIYSLTGGYMGMSFAIPIDVAMNVKDELMVHGKVTRGRIGVTVQEVSSPLAQSFGLKKVRGALIAEVEENAPAAKAGLKAGDVIVAFDGKPVEVSVELPAIVAATPPGETVDVRIVRDGAERTIKLVVAAMPAGRMNLARAESGEQGKLGVAVRETGKGMLVERAEGAAARAGLRSGDLILGVNGRPVKSIEELESVLDDAGKTAALRVQRGDSTIFVPVRIG